MKSTSLLLGLLTVSVGAFAQKANLNQMMPAKALEHSAQIQPVINASPYSFEFGDTLFYSDFSTPSEWTAATAPGSTGDWVFGTNAEIGNGFFADGTPFASTTAANGYAMFDSDGFGQSAQNNASITSGPIDISGFTGGTLAVSFQQWYARFADVASIQVSNDGTNFTAIGDNTLVPQLTQNSGAPTANPDIKTVPIPASFTTSGTIFIRFNFVGNWDYTWLVDDVALVEVIFPDFELEFVKSFHGNILTNWEYAVVPLSQATVVELGAIIRNSGALAQGFTVNYDILLSGASVNSGSWNIASIQPGTLDTSFFATGFTPSALGTYTVNFTVTGQNPDNDPSNNASTRTFAISEFFYSGIDNLTGAQGIGYSGATAPFRPYKLGHTFIINNEQELRAVEFAVTRPSVANNNIDLIIELFEASNTGAPSGDPIATETYSLTTSHPQAATWTRVVLEQPVILNPGVAYVLSVGQESTEKQLFFWTKPGDDDFASWIYGPFGAGGNVSWFVGLDLTPALRLNFDNTINTNEVGNIDSQVSIYPNPANNTLNIRTRIEGGNNYTLRVTDIQGRIVIENEVKKGAGIHMETIATDKLNNGIYNVQVISSTGISSKKVVIAH
jgi:hypothetical protein